MRRSASLLLALVLAACQPGGAGTTVRPTSRSAAPTSPPSTPATTKPRDVQAALLEPPGTPYQRLSGTIVVDPAWLQAKAAGTVVSNNGSSVAAPNGGSIISDNGTSLLVDAGGGLVAAANGNLIPDDSHGLAAHAGGMAAIAPDGSLAAAGGIISDNGAGLVGNNAAGLVGNNAAGLTSKVKFALAQAQERPPTAGMLISAVSLKSHQYLPVGVDAAGKPVYAVYSNLKGEYQLFLPADEAGNVLIVASPPNSHDPHVVYNAFTPAKTDAVVAVDEDVAQATRLLRRIFVPHMARLLANATDDGYLNNLDAASSSSNAVFDQLVKQTASLIGQRALKAGFPSGPGAANVPEVQLGAQQMSDAAVAFLNAAALESSKLYAPDWDGPEEPAIKALGQSFGLIRAAAAHYLDAHPGPSPTLVAFQIDGRATVGGKVPACPIGVTASLAGPDDLSAFVVDRILGGTEAHTIINLRKVLEQVAVPPVPAGTPFGYSATSPDWYVDATTGQQLELARRVNACMEAITANLALGIAPGDEPPPALQIVLAGIDDFAKSHTFSAVPTPGATPTCAPDAAPSSP